MELRVSIGDRQMMLILAIIIGVSMVGLALAYGGTSPSTIGHTPGELAPGTFKGGGSYIFPPDSSVNVQGGLTVGGSLNSANIAVTGNATVSDTITANNVIGNTKMACPSGFISVESQGRQLGCMQAAEANSGTGLDWRAANNHCFTNYGGKLPSLAEWYISMANFNMYDEMDDYEWVDDSVEYRDLQKIVGSGSLSAQTHDWGYGVHVFRCWIPA